MSQPLKKKTKFSSSIPLVQLIPTGKSANFSFMKNPTITSTPTNITPVSPEKIVVIHPGSKHLRIGRASDAFPQIVPHLIIRKVLNSSPQQEEDTINNNNKTENNNILFTKENKNLLTDSVAETIKTKKIKTISEAHNQIHSFNSTSKPTKILDHNDPNRIEWYTTDKDYILGKKVPGGLNLKPENMPYHYKIFYPIQHGLFNTVDYSSVYACINDLQIIWTSAIETELSIQRKEFGECHAVLVVPDVFNKYQLSQMANLLLKDMGFKALIVHQESIMAAFGAGISSACVVDIGDQVTSVACIEDGMCNASSLHNLKYGGSDVTNLFTSLVVENEFPYRNLDIQNNFYHYQLMNDLKEKICTLNEMDLTVDVSEFYVREPFKPTMLYKFKTFDDRYKAPLVLINPEIIDFKSKLSTLYSADTYLERCSKNIDKQPFSEREKLPSVIPSDVASISVALDAAIARSISKFARHHAELGTKTNDIDSKVRKICSNILLIGGGSKIANLGALMQEKLNFLMNLSNAGQFGLYRSSNLERPINVTIVQSPRDIDSRVLVWKGASVLAKLDLANELWLGQSEWESGGMDKASGKWLFSL